jgi:hypothetical protein
MKVSTIPPATSRSWLQRPGHRRSHDTAIGFADRLRPEAASVVSKTASDRWKTAEIGKSEVGRRVAK